MEVTHSINKYITVFLCPSYLLQISLSSIIFLKGELLNSLILSSTVWSGRCACCICACVFLLPRLSLAVFLQPLCGFVLSARKWLSILSAWDGEVMGLCLRQCTLSVKAVPRLKADSSCTSLLILAELNTRWFQWFCLFFFYRFTWTEM